MRRKTIFLVILVLCLTAFAAACKSSDKESGDKVLSFLSPETDPTSVGVDQTIIEKFEQANPGVKIDLTHGDLGDILPKLSAMIKAGNAPDIAFLSPRYVPALSDQKSILELEDLLATLGDIPRNLVTPTSDGKAYDIPAVTESMGLYYRKDLFEAAGLQPPTTWDEWLFAAQTLTQDTNADGTPDVYGMSIIGGMPDNYYPFSNILWANGAEFFDADNNVAIDSPEAIEALDFWGKLAQYCPPGMTNTLTNDVGLLFAQGQSAMVVWPGRIMTLIDRYNPDLKDKIGFVAIPQGPSGTTPVIKATINDFVVFSNTKYPDIAKKFIQFYLSDEQYQLFLTASVPGHMLPVRTSWQNNEDYLNSEKIAPWKDIVAQSMEMAFEYGTDFQFRNDGKYNPTSSQALASTVLNQEMNKFFLGQVTAEQCMKTIGDEWRKTFNIQ
jgi:multiple sugar transport system substrate-binding protein